MSTFLQRPTNPKKCFSPAQTHEWLHEHIPYRIVSGMALTPIAKEWDFIDSPIAGDGFQFLSANYAILEGRAAAVRWLIEFIGIQRSKDGKPSPSRAAREVDITDAGIWLLPNGANMLGDHESAQELADAWKGCSQAVAHPTVDSNHPPVLTPQITSAMRAILKFLEAGIYRKLNLKAIVYEYGRRRHPAMQKAPLLPVSE